MRKWTHSESHEIGPVGDELIWKEYSLGLVINRHCVEFWDDGVVSDNLRFVRRKYKLPWEL